MSATETIDLRPFCAMENTRYAFSQPWVKGGFRYACDGRIAVRLLAEDVPDTDTSECPNLPNIDDVLSTRPNELKPVPRLSPNIEKEPCDECDGSGRNMVDCVECDGSGETTCPHCGSDVECERCDGAGKVSGGKGKCARCGGSGKQPKVDPVEIDSFYMAGHYYLLIRGLPNVRYAIDAKNKMMLHFVFDGGDGAVMGLNRK